MITSRYIYLICFTFYIETTVGCVTGSAGEEDIGKARKFPTTCGRFGAHCEAHFSGVLFGAHDKQQ